MQKPWNVGPGHLPDSPAADTFTQSLFVPKPAPDPLGPGQNAGPRATLPFRALGGVPLSRSPKRAEDPGFTPVTPPALGAPSLPRQ